MMVMHLPGLSKKKKLMIYDMIRKGFDDESIKKMTGVDIDIIINFRGGADFVKSSKIVRSKKKAGESKGSNNNSINKSKAVKQQPGDRNEGSNPIGETIEFIGGKKDMADKKKSDGSTAEIDYNICGKCGGQVEGNPKKCPHCEAEFDYE